MNGDIGVHDKTHNLARWMVRRDQRRGFPYLCPDLRLGFANHILGAPCGGVSITLGAPAPSPAHHPHVTRIGPCPSIASEVREISLSGIP